VLHHDRVEQAHPGADALVRFFAASLLDWRGEARGVGEVHGGASKSSRSSFNPPVLQSRMRASGLTPSEPHPTLTAARRSAEA